MIKGEGIHAHLPASPMKVHLESLPSSLSELSLATGRLGGLDYFPSLWLELRLLSAYVKF